MSTSYRLLARIGLCLIASVFLTVRHFLDENPAKTVFAVCQFLDTGLGELDVGGRIFVTNGVKPVVVLAEADGQGASKWGKLKSGAGWISLDYAKKV